MNDPRFHRCVCCGKKYPWARSASRFIEKCKRCVKRGR